MIPELLLNDRSIPPLAKLLYVVTEVYRPESVTTLANMTGLSRSLTSKLCGHLAKQGWLYKASSGCRVVPIPAIPFVVQEQMVQELLAAFSASRFKGELLLRKWLDYLIISEDHMDNARPSFLRNPLTGEPLELDRHYPKLRLGFEHHGPQHFGVTKQHPSVDEFNGLRSRDLMKIGLCREHGITLVVVAADDLRLDTLLKAIPSSVPTRQVDPNGPYVKALEKLSAEYKTSISRIQVREIIPARPR